jgi:hypothetical protein
LCARPAASGRQEAGEAPKVLAAASGELLPFWDYSIVTAGGDFLVSAPDPAAAPPPLGGHVVVELSIPDGAKAGTFCPPHLLPRPLP